MMSAHHLSQVIGDEGKRVMDDVSTSPFPGDRG